MQRGNDFTVYHRNAESLIPFVLSTATRICQPAVQRKTHNGSCIQFELLVFDVNCPKTVFVKIHIISGIIGSRIKKLYKITYTHQRQHVSFRVLDLTTLKDTLVTFICRQIVHRVLMNKPKASVSIV